jgi:hypothetical protein
MNATTTCIYTYITVQGTLDAYPVVDSSQCSTEYPPLSASIISATSSPVYVQDAGNVSFGLAVVTALLSLMLSGLVVNSIFRHKRK